MKTLDLIESKEIDNEDLKKYYDGVVELFKKHGVDVRKYILLHRDHNAEGHIDILVIDLNSLLEDQFHNFSFFDIFTTYENGDREKILALRDMLQKKFIKKEEVFHNMYTLHWNTMPEEKKEYYTHYVGPQVERKNFDKPFVKGIEGQFMDKNIVSFASYVIEIVLDRLMYDDKQSINLSVGCFLWNLMENKIINPIVASSTMLPFYMNADFNQELAYGIPKDFLLSTLKAYGVSKKKIDFNNWPGIQNKSHLLNALCK